MRILFVLLGIFCISACSVAGFFIARNVINEDFHVESVVDRDNEVVDVQERAKGGVSVSSAKDSVEAAVAGTEAFITDVFAGSGINIGGNSKQPVINNAGVLSLQGEIGGLELTVGDGIGISGLEISNLDGGSKQHIFKSVAVGSTSFSADSNSDELKFAAGDGISISADIDDGKIIVASTLSQSPTSLDFGDILGGTSEEGLIVGSGGSLSVLGAMDVGGSLSLNGLSGGLLSVDGGGVVTSGSLDFGGSGYLSGLLPLSLGGTGASSAAGARSNLGLGALAVLDSVDVSDSTNLGVSGPLSLSGDVLGFDTETTALSQYTLKSNNLSDLASASAARANLGLGALAVEGVDTEVLSKYLKLSGGTLGGELTISSGGLDVESGDVTFGANKLSNGAFYYTNDFFGIYDTATGKYFGMSSGISPSGFSGSVVLGGYYNGWGTKGSSYNTGKSIFTVFSSNNQIGIQVLDNLNVGINRAVPTSALTIGGTAVISTTSNHNFSLLPNGTGYTIIGNAGITSHGFNTNDDLLVSGRMETDGLSYFDNHVRIGGASLCINSIDSACSGSSAGTLYASNTTVQAADVAENYISEQKLEAGDVVMPSGTSEQAVIKTSLPYQNEVIGVVSSDPGVTLNSKAKTDNSHPYLYPIALSGRVPVKVSGENGDIHVGDLLTSSSVAGVAMKATRNGAVIGKALNSFSRGGVGKIMVFITLSSYLPAENNLASVGLSDFDLKDLKSDVASLSAKIADLPDFDLLSGRIDKLEAKVASVSGNKVSAFLMGEGVIEKGSTEVVIVQDSVTDRSKIFVTATATSEAALAVVEKRSGDSFVVAIAKPMDRDLPFDWWLVN